MIFEILLSFLFGSLVGGFWMRKHMWKTVYKKASNDIKDVKNHVNDRIKQVEKEMYIEILNEAEVLLEEFLEWTKYKNTPYAIRVKECLEKIKSLENNEK